MTEIMKKITIAITAASYSGNKGAAAMLQSSIAQLKEKYGTRLDIRLMSVYPAQDRLQCPHGFVKIIPAQPQKILFLAFPCAVLYRAFFWCPPARAVLRKNEILKNYLDTDLVIDEAGIAFSDSRGFIMNTYAFVCAAVPMLMDVPVVKYSQALGPFHNAYNRLLAKWILPKMKLVMARGRFTYGHLKAAGIQDNVRLCADGAFTMPPDPAAEERAQRAFREAGFSHAVAVSVSSVVEKKSKKAGIDYCKIMAEFISYLTGRGFQVYMFANAAREHSRRLRNNDLMTGDAVARAYQQQTKDAAEVLQKRTEDTAAGTFQKQTKDAAGVLQKQMGDIAAGVLQQQTEDIAAAVLQQQAEDGAADEFHKQDGARAGLIWERREMDAEEIRARIGQCEMLVASRFHAMVFALSEQVPVMLVGWSHKYQEVMEQFGLGGYAADYSKLSLEGLITEFGIFLEHQEEIRCQIKEKLPGVRHSSRQNIRYITEFLDRMMAEREQKKIQPGNPGKNRKYKKKKALMNQAFMNHTVDLNDPDRYIGPHLSCRMGYAADAGIRENAASGGMVTAFLCSLLKNGSIDGAWVVRTSFTKDGRLAYETYIAQTPQQIREASSSVYMKIPMMSHLDQLRQFHGRLAVVLTPCMMRAFNRILEKDSSLRKKIVLKIGLFCSGAHDERATEYALDKCHIPREGAVRLYYRRGHWRGTSSVLYNDGSRKEFSYTRSVCAYKNAYFFTEKSCLKCKDQFAETADISFGDVWLSEVKKDAVKYTGCVIRSRKAFELLRRAEKQGDLFTRPMTDAKMLQSQKRALTFKYRGKRWNHRLAGYLAERNRRFSVGHPEVLKRVPMRVIYYYMCVIRLLLSW